MPRKPKENKRYQNAGEIELAIDNTKLLVEFLRCEALILDRFAMVMRDFPDFATFESKHVKTLSEYRELAERKRTRASNLELKKIQKLKEALAQINTGIFPEIIEDESIPA